MSFSFLPEELLRVVLEELYYNSTLRNRTAERSDLLACALVCTAWTNAAQRMLLHTVDTRRERHDLVDKSERKEKPHDAPRTVALFTAAMDPRSARGHILGQYVRSLEVGMLDVAGAGAYADDLRPFSRLLSFCPRLYQLLVDATGVVAISQTPLLELQETAKLPNLRALHILHCGVQSQVLYQFFDLWPTIEFVRLGSELVATPPTPICKAHIYELMLGRLPSTEVLSWLLASSTTSLEILEFRDTPGRILSKILDTHGAHLRALRLLRYEPSTEAALARCTRLEELVLLQVFSLTRRNPSNVALLPRTLRHFGFRGTQDMAAHRMQILVHWIDALPDLQVVSCNYRNEHDHQQYGLLQSKCEEKGVSLEYEAKAWWRYDDPVKTNVFPRRQCATNLSLMH